MKTLARRALAVHLLTLFVLVSPAGAQSAPSGLSQALLALDNAPPGPIRDVIGRLFGALVDADIIDRNRDQSDFDPADEINFVISRGGTSLAFDRAIRTRDEFEDWARDNAGQLLALLFPGSISSAVLGRDAAQLYSQQLLLSTILNVEAAREPGTPRRFGAGGLVEFEWFEHENQQNGDSGRALQGLYGIGRFASVQGRFARQRDDLSTRAVAVAFDYHPYREIGGPVIVRVGATARSGFLYSHSASLSQSSRAIDLGTLDFGGGGWVSVRKDYRRVRVGGGGLFQGTKSVVPNVGNDEELGFLADVINSRGLSWDLAYGGTVGVDTSAWTAVIAKYLESHPLKEEFERPSLRLFLIGYSFTLAPGSAVDAGYKITSAGGVRSGALFLQGNFGW